MKPLIMSLATLVIVSLVSVTWALIRISRWIVTHDPVWDQMDREGAGMEHMIAEGFLVANKDFYLPFTETVVGIIFLTLLWKALQKEQIKS